MVVGNAPVKPVPCKSKYVSWHKYPIAVGNGPDNRVQFWKSK